MKTWIAAVCTSMTLLAGTAYASANPVVYQQAPSGTPNAYASQFDTGANGDFSKVYDDFSLAADTTITDIHWLGQYFAGSRTNGVDSFLIQFWSDTSAAPGSLLYAATVTSANETLVSGDTYSYDVDLANAFLAQAGTTYWVSIQARMLFPPQWGWSEGTGGNGTAVQDFVGNRSNIAFDMAFSLTGVPTSRLPEPASVLLVGLALSGVGVARRAKAKR